MKENREGDRRRVKIRMGYLCDTRQDIHHWKLYTVILHSNHPRKHFRCCLPLFSCDCIAITHWKTVLWSINISFTPDTLPRPTYVPCICGPPLVQQTVDDEIIITKTLFPPPPPLLHLIETFVNGFSSAEVAALIESLLLSSLHNTSDGLNDDLQMV